MPLVSLIIPTFNEQENIAGLIEGIRRSLDSQFQYEILVVDDGSDATSSIAELLDADVIAGKHKGLGQAIVDGMAWAKGDVVVVMDADGSHPTESLPAMINPILDDKADFCLGSRYVKGGSVVDWTLKRKIISKVASLIAYPITGIRDNTSGYFACSSSILDGVDIQPSSWKIMLETLVKAKPKRVIEVPIRFEDRKYGESKFNKKEVVSYLKHLVKLAVFKHKRFLKFVVVGATGVAVNFGILYLLTDKIHFWYLASATLAVLIAASTNYLQNHYWTFKEKRENNPNVFKGWLKYLVAVGVTEVLYLGLMYLFTSVLGFWYMVSAVCALGITTILRFVTADRYIWGTKK